MKRINKYFILCFGVTATVIFCSFSKNFSFEGNNEPTPSTTDSSSRDVYYNPPTISEVYNFAGENVPIERTDIYERLDREMLSNSYFHSNTFLMIKRANRYFPMIDSILNKEKIPLDFKFLAVIESSLDPRCISPAGAAGIWQFMKGTAKEMGLEVNDEVDERYNIEKATIAACKYFKQLYTKYNSWTMVAAAYNAGHGKIDSSISKQKQSDYYDLLLNSETKRYVFRIVALKTIMNTPLKYGFKLKSEDLYTPIRTQEFTIKDSISSIADYALGHKTTYAMLKDLNPWLRDFKLTNKYKKEYKILVPFNTKEDKSIQVYYMGWVSENK